MANRITCLCIDATDAELADPQGNEFCLLRSRVEP
jgi:hypothetical protein